MKSNLNSIIKLSLFLSFAIFLVYAYKKSDTYATNYQQSISKKIVRFHVIANSDSEEDQELKLKVRDGILDSLKNDMKNSSSFDDTINIINAKIPTIIEVAKSIINENGYDYEVTATIDECYFPAKTYCDIILPPGNYTALKVIIGNGDGHNWWCVMYPTLCFIDNTTAILPKDSKNELQSILTPEEYDSILLDELPETADDVSVKYSSHFLEIIKSIFNRS